MGHYLTRKEMIPDQDWYSSEYFQMLHRTLGADATLVCFERVSGTVDEYNELFLARGMGEHRFSGRARVIAQEAMREVSRLVGGPLARFQEPSPADLPPRAQQVLRCLLEGDTDKQVAARLALTRHTVNQYTKTVFAHFHVRSRAELLARWIRRGWGGRLAWAGSLPGSGRQSGSSQAPFR